MMTKNSVVRRSCVWASLVLMLASCARETAQPKPTIGYPRGPWWRGDMNYTLLGVAHILIAHRASASRDRLMTMTTARPNRSQAEALQRALELAGELQKHPERFAALARSDSDDATTAAFGGDLGAVFAPHLPAAMVDAIGNLRVGQVSRVIETSLGYHIVKRLAVEPEQKVSGREIVVGYNGSLTTWRPGRGPSRSREAARALADDVRGKARGDEAAFSALATQYSDTFDAESGGDLGEWSTYARNGEPLTLHTLARLRSGEVSPVLDTPDGYRIVMRTAARPRRTLGVSLAAVGYTASWLPNVAALRSRADAKAAIELAVRGAMPSAAEFEAFASGHCDYQLCAGPRTFEEGDATLGALVEPLSHLEVGQISPAILEVPGAFVVARREEPSARTNTEHAVTLELPRPEAVTLENTESAQLVWYLGHLRDLGRAELALRGAEADRFTDLFVQAVANIEHAAASERGEHIGALYAGLGTLLGAERAQRIAQLHRRLFDEYAGRLDGQATAVPRSADQRSAPAHRD
jgi:hypothetical protein